MRRLVLMISLLMAGAGALLAGALPAEAAAVPVITLSSSVNPSAVGGAVTFTATVTEPGGPAPAGTVVFTCTCMTATARTLVAVSTTTSTASVIQGFTLPGSYTISAAATVTNIDTGVLTASLIQHVEAVVATPTPTVTPSMTPSMTPTATVTPAPTTTVTVPGMAPPAAAVVPVGAVGTGGGGSLGSGPDATLIAIGGGLILAGAGTGGLAIRRRRGARKN